MTTAYTSLLGLALPVTGELSGTWGDTVNNSITSLLDSAVAGTTNVSTDADVTLTTTTGAANTAREAILLFSGSRTALRTITAPAQSKVYTVINATTGGYSVKLVGAGPTTGVTIVAGESAVCAWNGSDFVKVGELGGDVTFRNLTAASITNTGLTSGRVVYSTTGGLETDSANLTFNGTTLTANTLNLTNALGTTYGGTGLTSFTANGVVYASSSSALATGSALTFDGSNLGITASSSAGFVGSTIQNTSAGSGASSGLGINNDSTASTYLRTYGSGQTNSLFGSVIANYTAILSDGVASNGILFGTLTNKPIIFGQNNAESMRLNSTGLGIGTSSPARKLQVKGTGAMFNNASGAFEMLIGDENYRYFGLYTPSSPDYLAIRYSTTDIIRFDALASNVIVPNGNLGVGTSSPSSKLTVGGNPPLSGAIAGVGASGGISLALSDNVNSSLYVKHVSAGVSTFGTDSGGQLAFATNGFSERMRIDASGNVGIGTSSPSGKLDVYVSRTDGTNTNALYVSDSATGIATVGFGSRIIGQSNAGGVKSAVAFENGGDGTNNQSQLAFYTQNAANALTRQMTISSTGNVGIGTSSPTNKLTVVGNANITSSSTNSTGFTLGNTAASGVDWTLYSSGGGPTTAGSFGIYNNSTSTNALVLSAANNLGLGVTPSAWNSNYKGFQMNGGALQAYTTGDRFSVNQNNYVNTSGVAAYVNTGYASQYLQLNSEHRFYTAPSGTAGNAITFTQAMTLDASGNLLVGQTSNYVGESNWVESKSGYVFANNSTSSASNRNWAINVNGSGAGNMDWTVSSTNTGWPNFAYRMTLDASGNLGIGTTSPAEKLSVAGAIRVHTASSAGFTSDSKGGLVDFVPASNNVRVGYVPGTSGVNTGILSFVVGSGAEAARFDSSGNFGIGTTSPTARLSVAGNIETVASANRYLKASGWISNQVGQDSDFGFSDVGIVAKTGTNLCFITGNGSTGNGNERARIDSSGNFGIGTTSPSSYGKLAVSNDSTTATGARFDNGSASITGKNVWSTYTSSGNNNTTAIHFAAYDGSVGGDVFRVYGNGNVVNNNNSYGAISDAKLKENIVDASPKLADLMLVKVRSYNLKTNPTHKQLGVVAQELEEVFPAIVEETADKDMEGNNLGTTTKAVKYSVFVPMLIKAMQEQQAIIESLKARLDAANL
jgi:Chaperone of endosialidase